MNANSRGVHTVEEMVGRIRTRSISFTSEHDCSNLDTNFTSTDDDVSNQANGQSLPSSAMTLTSPLLPPDHPWKKTQCSLEQHDQMQPQWSHLKAQEFTAPNSSELIHAPCNVIINGLKIEVAKCHAMINELQHKLDIVSSTNDCERNVKTCDNHDGYHMFELENVELRRLLSEAEFRSQALENQINEVPRDITIAMAEKRVLETKLAHALGSSYDDASNDLARKGTYDQNLVKEYQLTIHQLTLSLQQMKMQLLEDGNCNVSTRNKNHCKDDTNSIIDNNDENEKENINRRQKLDRKKKSLGVDAAKQSKIMKADNNMDGQETHVSASTKTVSKLKKKPHMTSSMPSSEGFQKHSTKRVGTTGARDVVVSEAKPRPTKTRGTVKRQALQKT